jgi:hypothetical protein
MSLVYIVGIVLTVGVVVALGVWMVMGAVHEFGGGRRKPGSPKGIPSSDEKTAVSKASGEEVVQFAEWCITVVLCTDGLPSLDAWNAELADQDLDVVLLPVPDDLAAREKSLVRVRGTQVWLNFVAAPMEANEDWFPTGKLFLPNRKGAARIGWPARDVRAEAAAWAIAGALAILSSGNVFVGEGVGATDRLSPWYALLRATELMKALPDRYDEGEFDVEASTAALIEEMLRSHDEIRQTGVNPEPSGPTSTDRNL